MFKYIQIILFICMFTIACANQTPALSISTPTPSLNKYFPQMLITPSVYLDLPLIEGQLVLENGCLRVRGVKGLLAGDNFLIIWDIRFSTITDQGFVSVIDSSTGEVLASVGDYVNIASNGTPTHPTIDIIPDECLGPYMSIGEFIRKIEKP